MDVFEAFSLITFFLACLIWNEVSTMRKEALAAQQSARFKLEDIASVLGDLSEQVELLKIQQEKTQAERGDRAPS